jgi:dihydroorotate dehydrogenase
MRCERIHFRLFRHVAVRVPAELTHRVGLRTLGAATPLLRGPLGATPDPSLAVDALGLHFASPLGVAAGYDKDAEGVRGLARLGFGAVEVGTVTARPQPGNPRPRLFRLPADRALVNRMGFNNAGADAVARRLAALRAVPGGAGTVVGVNIGRSKAATGPGETVADYVYSARTLGPHADYVVVNVSSPNTAGLRDLQGVEALEPLLRAVRDALGPTPLLVKITADLDAEGVDAVANLALALGLDGIVDTNTTVARTGLRTDPAEVDALGPGGLSGAPLAGAADAHRALAGGADGKITLVP